MVLAKKYRKEWKEKLWESMDIEEFGMNEFIGGKAEASEECLEVIMEYKNNLSISSQSIEAIRLKQKADSLKNKWEIYLSSEF